LELGLHLVYSRKPARRWEADVDQNSLCPFCVASKGADRGNVSISIPLEIRWTTRGSRPFDTWLDDQMLGVAPRFVEEQTVAVVTGGRPTRIEVELDPDTAALLAWRDGRLRRVPPPGFRLPLAPVLVTCGASTDSSPAISGSARSFCGGQGD
jgi:hypothetical protein